MAVVDLEMGEVFEYESNSERLDWFDNSMIASTVDGSLVVWDFDHTNLRTLVQQKKLDVEGDENLNDDLNATGLKQDDSAEPKTVTTFINAEVAHYPALVSSNNRFMYYVVKTHDGLTLMRERIRD